jgi:hypothetical protein
VVMGAGEHAAARRAVARRTALLPIAVLAIEC